VKLLIPNNFVTKLIGAKGCMIREIAAKAGGAQIKILSDKQSEKEFQECVVAVAGSLANKQDAACYILEQIETFKNGGPILLSGKSINENLALQFRNSVPIRDNSGSKTSHPKEKEKSPEHIKRDRSKSFSEERLSRRDKERNNGKDREKPEKDSVKEKDILSKDRDSIVKEKR